MRDGVRCQEGGGKVIRVAGFSSVWSQDERICATSVSGRALSLFRVAFIRTETTFTSPVVECCHIGEKVANTPY